MSFPGEVRYEASQYYLDEINERFGTRIVRALFYQNSTTLINDKGEEHHWPTPEGVEPFYKSEA